MKNIKVISLGISQANFLLQLYNGISDLDDSIIVDLDAVRRFSSEKGKDTSDHGINEIKDFKSKVYFKDIIWAGIQLIFVKYSYIYLLSRYQNEARFSFSHIRNLLKSKAVVNKYFKGLKYDIFHFHFCEPSSLLYLYFLPDNAKTICTFWGSDLLRVNGVFNYYLQEKALRKATIITSPSPEFREIILAKFGRDLKHKVKYALFNLETRLFTLIDKFSRDSSFLLDFKKKYHLSAKKIIVVGNNANPFNNHLDVLKSLDQCSEQIRRDVTFVLPFTYGGNPGYVEQVEILCAEISIKTVLIKEFMSWEDLAALRLCTDIFIHMPESDALSGAAIEAMYAGSLLVAGAWLPYGNFRRSGLIFREVVDYSNLPSTIESVVLNGKDLSLYQKLNNRRIINEHYLPGVTSIPWINIYNELVKKR